MQVSWGHELAKPNGMNGQVGTTPALQASTWLLQTPCPPQWRMSMLQQPSSPIHTSVHVMTPLRLTAIRNGACAPVSRS